MAAFTLPPLPYDYSALEPVLSKETLEYHHDRHHKAYVDKLNELLERTPYENQPLESIIREASGPLFNQAAQHWNHTFLWNCMTPEKNKNVGSLLGSAILKQFGSFEQFKIAFEKQGNQLFGSGYIWLVSDTHRQLFIQARKDADNPIRDGLIPIFTCDVWEHAYYIDYRNRRNQFLSQFWQIVNWDFAEENFRLKASSHIHEPAPHFLA